MNVKHGCYVAVQEIYIFYPSSMVSPTEFCSTVWNQFQQISRLFTLTAFHSHFRILNNIFYTILGEKSFLKSSYFFGVGQFSLGLRGGGSPPADGKINILVIFCFFPKIYLHYLRNERTTWLLCSGSRNIYFLSLKYGLSYWVL